MSRKKMKKKIKILLGTHEFDRIKPWKNYIMKNAKCLDTKAHLETGQFCNNTT